jgi:hypothetical protein
LKMDLTEGSETSAKLNQTPGKYPKENIQVSEHGKNLKSRIIYLYLKYFNNFNLNSFFLLHIFNSVSECAIIVFPCCRPHDNGKTEQCRMHIVKLQMIICF